MKRCLALVASLTFVLCTLVVAQAGLAGRWEGKTNSGRPLLLNVKTAEGQLTGTITVDKETVDISAGKVAKNTFSFEATVQDRPMGFKGEVAGDEITLTVEGIKNPVMLKRVK